MEWIGCVRCEKFRCEFMARNFALIAPVHPILHRVSWSYEMIPNAPKLYTTHQNMSLVSNGADWVCSLWKIPTWLRGTNFYINCTSSHRFAPSAVTKPQQMHRNTMKHMKTWVQGPMGWIGCVHCEKSRRDFMAWTFCINCTSSPCFASSFMQLGKQSQMHPNTMQRTKTWV